MVYRDHHRAGLCLWWVAHPYRASLVYRADRWYCQADRAYRDQVDLSRFVRHRRDLRQRPQVLHRGLYYYEQETYLWANQEIFVYREDLAWVVVI